MSDEETRYIGNLQKLEVVPGDIFVLQCDEYLSNEAAKRLRVAVEGELPGHKVLVFGRGITFGVMTKKAA